MLTRRNFFKLGGFAAASAALGCRGKRSARRGDELLPAIVVGSGFGGSVAALRLGEAGITTIVLEKGRRWTLTDSGDTFSNYRKPDGRARWLDDTLKDEHGKPIPRYTGVFQRRQFDMI